MLLPAPAMPEHAAATLVDTLHVQKVCGTGPDTYRGLYIDYPHVVNENLAAQL